MTRIVWSLLAFVAFEAAAIGLTAALGDKELLGSVVRGCLFALVVFVTTSFILYRTRRRR